MKWRQTSTKTIELESYVTLRQEWPYELASWVSLDFCARGHRVVDGRMEWQYFSDEIAARKWSERIHGTQSTDIPHEVQE